MFDTKPNLNSGKFEQYSGDTLNLSGVTNFITTAGGDLRIDGISIKDLTGSTSGGSATLADNGLTKVGNTIVLGGGLTGDTLISGGSNSFNVQFKSGNVDFDYQYGITTNTTGGTGGLSFIKSAVGFNGSVQAIARQPDGKYVIGGDFTTYDDQPHNRIIRLNADGTIDTSISFGTGFDSTVNSLAIQDDGKILVGGNFSNYNGQNALRLTRLQTSGVRDNTFLQPVGINGFDGPVLSIVIQADDNILVGGSFTSFLQNPHVHIIRLLGGGGAIDPSWEGTGCTEICGTTVTTIALQNDGKILIGGSFLGYGGVTARRIARLNSDGTLDGTFSHGTGFNTNVYSIVLQSDNKIVVGGIFTEYSGTSRQQITRLNTDGYLDETWNGQFNFGASVGSRAIVVYSDDSIIVGGDFDAYVYGTGNTVVTSPRLIRLLENGDYDPTLVVDNPTNQGIVHALSVTEDGEILVGGAYANFNRLTAKNIVLLKDNGEILSFNSKLLDILITNTEKIIYGGVSIAAKNANLSIGSCHTAQGGNNSAIVGGLCNSVVDGCCSTIVGGRNQSVCGANNFVAGGYNNEIQTQISCSSIVGGSYNTISEYGGSGCNSLIAGGNNNTLCSTQSSAIVGGSSNQMYSHQSAIVGGSSNNICQGADSSAIVGGESNQICCGGHKSGIVGGSNNRISGGAYGYDSFVGGGNNNNIAEDAHASSIIGGYSNTICGIYSSGGYYGYYGSLNKSSIVGGSYNRICCASLSSIVGGFCNTIMSGTSESTIIGGRYNTIEGGNISATIIGGNNIDLTGTTYTNTVAVPSLAIMSTPQTGEEGMEFLVRDSSTGIIKTVTGTTGGGGSPVTANNGLTRSGDNIHLGGTLTGDTVVDTATFGIAFGYSVISCGANSFASGRYSCAYGDVSHAEGNTTYAQGTYSHAEGTYTCASGYGSHAEGGSTIASGRYAHAEGDNSEAIGNYGSHAEGNQTCAIGYTSHAEGSGTFAIGDCSHAEGNSTCAIGTYSHAQGNGTCAIGQASHAQGQSTHACGCGSHSSGIATHAIGCASHTEGSYSCAYGSSSHAEGTQTCAYGIASHAEGCLTCACGNFSHAEGLSTSASCMGSHAEGNETCAIGLYSHAEGSRTNAIGVASHAGGFGASTPLFACGCTSFNHSFNTGYQVVGHGANASYSAILGGQDHHIASGNTGAVIIGGNTIKLTGVTYVDTTAVAKLAIMTPLEESFSTGDTILVRDNATGIIKGQPFNGIAGLGGDFIYVQGCTNTNGTTPVDFANFTLEDNKIYSVRATIKGRKDDGTERALYVEQSLVYRQGGGAVKQGSVQASCSLSAGAGSWCGNINVVGNDVTVLVSGDTGDDVNWNSIMEIQRAE